MKKDTGRWTRNQIERERQKANRPTFRYRTVQGGEIKWFDTEDEALDWCNFVNSFNHGVTCVVEKIQVG